MKKEISYILSCITIIILIISIAFSKNNLIDTKQTLETNQNNYQESNPEIIEDDPIVAASITVPLTITNIQNDDTENEYTYNIIVNEVSGAQEVKINDKNDYIVFNAKGEAKFTLKNNETITFLNLPMDVEYKISQDKKDGYITKVDNENKTEYKGTLSIENKIAFENINPKVPAASKNPQTVDKIFYGFLTLLVGLTIIISLKNIKLKKYNN